MATMLQVRYAEHLENVRHNKKTEGEVFRHNRQTEVEQHRANTIAKEHYERLDAETNRSNIARETETHRANVAYETETNRHNVAVETETNRHNIVTEHETKRHNQASEGLQAQANAIQASAVEAQRQYQQALIKETNRANLVNEQLRADQLKLDERKQLVSSTNAAVERQKNAAQADYYAAQAKLADQNAYNKATENVYADQYYQNRNAALDAQRARDTSQTIKNYTNAVTDSVNAWSNARNASANKKNADTNARNATANEQKAFTTLGEWLEIFE